MQGPALSQPIKGVPGAAGTTVPIPRLGIPAIVLADGPAGLRIQPKRDGDAGTYYCTAFPIETLLASTWDVDLLDQVGRAMGNEVYEYGVDVLLGPALNTHRNPARRAELRVLLGGPARGRQDGRRDDHRACSRRASARRPSTSWRTTTSGTATSSTSRRRSAPFARSTCARFEILVTRRAAVDDHVVLQQAERPYTSENRALITGVARNDWGFKGLVMTDWFGGRDAVAQMNAGNDLLEPGTAAQQKALLAAVESGAAQDGRPGPQRRARPGPRPEEPDVQEGAALRQAGPRRPRQGGPRCRGAGHGAAQEQRRAAGGVIGEDARAVRQHLLRHDHGRHRAAAT